MKKSEFLSQLKKALESELDSKAVKENIDYYEDYIQSEIEKGRGTQFDPEIANIMLDIIDEDSNYTMRQEKVV